MVHVNMWKVIVGDVVQQWQIYPDHYNRRHGGLNHLQLRMCSPGHICHCLWTCSLRGVSLNSVVSTQSRRARVTCTCHDHVPPPPPPPPSHLSDTLGFSLSMQRPCNKSKRALRAVRSSTTTTTWSVCAHHHASGGHRSSWWYRRYCKQQQQQQQQHRRRQRRGSGEDGEDGAERAAGQDHQPPASANVLDAVRSARWASQR